MIADHDYCCVNETQAERIDGKEDVFTSFMNGTNIIAIQQFEADGRSVKLPNPLSLQVEMSNGSPGQEG